MQIDDLIVIYKDEWHKPDWASTLQRNTFFVNISWAKTIYKHTRCFSV